MKRKLTLTTACIFFGLIPIIGQHLEENKVDEFTGDIVKRTSWETLSMKMNSAAFFRISSINNTEYFDLKLILGGNVFSIEKGQEIMLKLSNDEIIKLRNLEYALTCTGCGANGLSWGGAQGIKVTYYLDKQHVERLKSNQVVKIRIYTSEGYTEEEIKKRNAEKIVDALKLI